MRAVAGYVACTASMGMWGQGTVAVDVRHAACGRLGSGFADVRVTAGVIAAFF
ncbi:MAG: hypothetical protein NTZ78_12190 [Candidatus Aureabacteria bacterium]|nr:hypothetical protein [Candidatus Auribacterota bacterium]